MGRQETKKGWMPEELCSDCGCVGCFWGSRSPKIVPEADPEGAFISFCVFCYNQRQKRERDGADPLPLGVKPPGAPEGFSMQEITVVTESGSEYHFGPPDENGIRSVSCETRDIGFNKCKILLLEKGEDLWFRNTDIGPEMAIWETTPVSSIS